MVHWVFSHSSIACESLFSQSPSARMASQFCLTTLSAIGQEFLLKNSSISVAFSALTKPPVVTCRRQDQWHVQMNQHLYKDTEQPCSMSQTLKHSWRSSNEITHRLLLLYARIGTCKLSICHFLNASISVNITVWITHIAGTGSLAQLSI